MYKKVVRTERGWAGHFILVHRCHFRRNTLLSCNGVQIVVSTVGLLHPRDGEKWEMIGSDRYFETMAFHAKASDTRYHDADVTKQVYFDSPWAISEIDADDRANDMHEAVVAEIAKKLRRGEKLEEDNISEED